MAEQSNGFVTAVSSLRCGWRGVMGADAYDRYVARHRVEHPDHEPMSEREWWRCRQEEADVKGCC